MNQNKPYIIALTGGIATGKSTVSKFIKEFGYEVLDSDKIVHDSYSKDSKVYHQIISTFGEQILNKFKEIDRKKLGDIVFNNSNKLKKLNSIVHEHVINELIKGIEKSSDKLIFLDIPLLIEEIDNLKDMGLKFNEIWLIYADPQLQLKRLLKRDNRGKQESTKIIKAQMAIDSKVKFADKVIMNNGTMEQLKEKIINEIKHIELKI